jgi:hypothetical protein
MLYLPKPDAAACARSDTYFMFVLDSVAPRAALRPPCDQAAWEALLCTVAFRAAKQGADTGWQLPCPACMALVHGVSSSQASHDAYLEAVLTARCPIFGHRCRIRHQQLQLRAAMPSQLA